ncbi:helix-turn-helix domain-containing protein [Actinomadura sp. 9N215]|uniref:helix-turn-helix domain-containing protein n=1 Tax=Actinomadura sp. 9N215 TaxID=3375150 RepID=UPI0037AF6692
MAAQKEPHDAPAIHAFADELTAWRELAGLTKTKLAEVLGYTPQWISQIESAKAVPSQEFAENLDTYFNTNGVFVRHWKRIQENRRYAALPPGFPEYVRHEAIASTMYFFDPMVINGLFQVPEYARELLKSGRDEEETETLLAERIQRQEILTRLHPPRIIAIFDEWAIRRVIGNAEVMRSQYERLIELAQRYNISIQIVPSTAGAYAGLMGAFTILEFHSRPAIVYTEGHIGGHLTDYTSAVQEYRLRYDLIRSAAMSADGSLKLLNDASEGT